MTEIWEARRKESRARRRNNRKSSKQILHEAGVKFKSANKGAHLMLKRPDGGRIDFWPGTGKWIDRVSGAKLRGVRPLIQHVKSLKIAWRGDPA